MYGAFQTLQEVDAHQAADTLLTSCLGQVLTLIVGQLFIFLELAGENVIGGRIHTQRELHELLINLVIVDGVVQIRQAGTFGN